MNTHGIKETKEVIIALSAIVPVIVKVMKDGVQVTDTVAIYNEIMMNPEVKEKMMTAIDNIKAVPEEVKDLQTIEVAELILVSAQQTFEVLKTLQA